MDSSTIGRRGDRRLRGQADWLTHLGVVLVLVPHLVAVPVSIVGHHLRYICSELCHKALCHICFENRHRSNPPNKFPLPASISLSLSLSRPPSLALSAVCWWIHSSVNDLKYASLSTRQLHCASGVEFALFLRPWWSAISSGTVVTLNSVRVKTLKS